MTHFSLGNFLTACPLNKESFWQTTAGIVGEKIRKSTDRTSCEPVACRYELSIRAGKITSWRIGGMRIASSHARVETIKSTKNANCTR